MKITKMRLKNFRQFYGEQELDFAYQSHGKNITVIHGYNGSGKTALLNAFIWCLYGKTTPDLEEPNRLVNETALAEAPIGQKLTVSVELNIKRGDETFLIERSFDLFKQDNETNTEPTGVLEIRKINTSGEWERLGRDPQNFIHRVLPVNLYPFFFFNGERVEQLASPSAYERVEEGVKTLLDIEIYERSVRHLRGSISGELSKELKSLGTRDLQEALEKEAGIKDEQEQLQEEIQTHKHNQAGLEKEIEELERAQGEYRTIQEKVMERSGIREQLKNISVQLQDKEQDLARVFSRDAYLSFIEEVIGQCEELVADARRKGEIPAKIKPQFVQDLLDACRCICGRPLHPDTEETAKLLEWRGTLGLAELEEAISYVQSAFPILRKRKDSYFEELDRIQASKSTYLGNRRQFIEKEELLNQEIGDRSHGEDIAGLEQRRRERLEKLLHIKVEIGKREDKLNTLETDLVKVQKEIRDLNIQDQRAQLIKTRKQAVDRIAGAMEEIYRIRKEDVRSYLARLVGQIWDSAAIKDYHASITDDFRLLLTKTIGGAEQPVYGASTGEKQVLALSFVGSLVQKARENAKMQDQGGYGSGGDYPIVMDSPFGSLEDDYRAKVAEWIPKLAEQVIVMASKTQWRDEVELGMRSRIGKEYILELHTPKKGSNRAIDIMGQEYPYVVESEEIGERTIVKEV